MRPPLSAVARSVIAAISLLAVAPLHAATYFDDLAADYGGVETVSGDRWLAAIFTTDASTATSLTATLSLAQSATGVAQLELYTDDGLQPGTFVATFTSPLTYSTTLDETSFTLTSVSLTASTNYWLVLSAPSGSFDWAWTSDFDLLQGWADSSDASDTWFGSDAYPPQYSVASGVASPADFNADGAVDADDLALWQANFSDTSPNAGDANGDEVVDGADFLIWQREYAPAAASLNITAVPEPSAALLALTALWSLHQFRRRRR